MSPALSSISEWDDTSPWKTVEIDGVEYEIHDTPEHVVIDVMCRQRGIRMTLVSPLHPTYVRPDNTLDDVL